MLFQTDERKTNRQSLLSVYFQSVVYYDEVFSYFALVFQYLLFIYKYNILFYASSTIAGEIILLSCLLLANGVRVSYARSGNKGKKYVQLLVYLVLDVLLMVGYIYILSIQANALYLETVIAIIGIVFTGVGLVLVVALMIMYRITQ